MPPSSLKTTRIYFILLLNASSLHFKAVLIPDPIYNFLLLLLASVKKQLSGSVFIGFTLLSGGDGFLLSSDCNCK